MNLEDRFNEVRNAFDDWNMEDVFTLRKAIELKRVSKNWDEGFLHLPRLRMLAIEFDYDPIIQKIYQHMLKRCNDFMIQWRHAGIQPDIDNLEMIFSTEPVVYDVNDETLVIYNYYKCKYKQRLKIKYPELANVIEDLVNA